jgi:anti-sigma regulatory factor (Ser/Thr protein kinase)
LQPFGLAPVPTDLPAFLDDIGNYAVALCTQQNNRFVYRALTSLPHTVIVDGTRLQQVLLNLLSNASKFTRDGRVTLAVDAREAAGVYHIGIEVADTGIGFSMDDKANMFQAFQQVHPSGGGAGLGLFIAEQIVQSMGGTLQVSSLPGAGTSFSFRIAARAVGSVLVPPVHVDAPSPSAPEAPATNSRLQDMSSYPDADALANLAALARSGRYTDIETWIDTYASSSCYAAFLDDVRRRTAALDFQGIAELVDSLTFREVIVEDDCSGYSSDSRSQNSRHSRTPP